MKKKILLVIIFIVGAVNGSLAAPTINTVPQQVNHGETVTIDGSSFGTKTYAPPLVWDDFNYGKSGELLKEHGWKVASDNIVSQQPQLSNSNLRHNNVSNTASFYFTRGSYYQEDVAWHENLAVSGTRRFIDYWIWYKMPTQPAGAEEHQLKLVRMQTGPGESTSDIYYPNFNTYAWRYNGGDRSTYYPVTTSSSNYVDYYLNENFKDGAWTHVKVAIDIGTPDKRDGVLKVWHNDSLVLSKSDVMYVESSHAYSKNYYDNFQIGKYLGNTAGAAETTIYYSDVYYDTSWARVEIGDKQIYADCTHQEIQIPSSWNNANIQFKVNAGTFPKGSTAYLFVIDANGNASTGKQITINSNSITTPLLPVTNPLPPVTNPLPVPNPPQNLRILG